MRSLPRIEKDSIKTSGRILIEEERNDLDDFVRIQKNLAPLKLQSIIEKNKTK
jgi:hypothetical protein